MSAGNSRGGRATASLPLFAQRFRGFTLVEVAVSIAIIAVLAATVAFVVQKYAQGAAENVTSIESAARDMSDSAFTQARDQARDGGPAEPALSYLSTLLSTGTPLTPAVQNLTGTVSFSYTGTLPVGVEFDEATGTLSLAGEPVATTVVEGPSTFDLGESLGLPAWRGPTGTPTPSILTVASQSDGKILMGGTFNTFHGAARGRFVRLNADGTLDADFNPNAGSTVHTIAIQSDGKILVGGHFITIGGETRNRIARLNADGTLDAGFNPNAGGTVRTIAIQSDGKIVVGGLFTTIGGETRNRIARLNADGTLDADFNPNAGGTVNTIAIQSDGKIVVGGLFTTIGGETRSRIARLNADGTLDADFNPNASSTVNTIAIQSDGKILVGGAFTTIGGETRDRIARLNADGTLDADFNPGANSTVHAITLDSDGNILVGGLFTNFQGLTGFNKFVRVGADGTLDTTLDPQFGTRRDEPVLAISARLDNAIIVVGKFNINTVGGMPANSIIRLNPGGVVDASFVPATINTLGSPGNSVYTLAEQSDGRIVIGGVFTTIGGETRNRIARLNADGTLDADFNPGANSTVSTIVIQSDGKILVGGAFSTIGGGARNRIARLNADGTLDADFNPGASSTVNTIVIQSDGKIVVGGLFTTIGGETRNRIARLNADGTLDADFNPNAGGTVNTIVIQSDGKIVVGGLFTTIGGETRDRIARLNADGTLDADFNPNASSTVFTIAIQSDGKIVVGGAFTTIGGETRSRIARLNADGTLDAGFNPGASSTVLTIAIQSDGKIVVGGHFTSIGGEARNRIARLNADGTLDSYNPNASGHIRAIAIRSDGKIIIGGVFFRVGGRGISSTYGPVRSRVAILNGHDLVDRSFPPIPTGAAGTGVFLSRTYVLAVTMQDDGKILVGGGFTTMNGLSRSALARLHPDGTLDAGFNPRLVFGTSVGGIGGVRDIHVLSDGKILIGGTFSSVNRCTRGCRYIARLNPDGTLDAGFNPNAGGAGNVARGINTIAIQSDGKILVGGAFTTIGGETRNRIARLNADGTLDADFNPDAGVTLDSRVTGVETIAIQSDGKILVGGAFSTIGGETRNRIARLNADGTLDADFNPNASSTVNTIAIQSDGKIVVGGLFTTIGGETRNRIARLNADGTLDADFNPNAGGTVNTIAIQSDGKIVVGGAFTTIGGMPRNRIARLNADGTPDTLSTAVTVVGEAARLSKVQAVFQQPDGRILIGGNFTTIGGVPRNRIARIADGFIGSPFTGMVTATDQNGTTVSTGVVTFAITGF